MAATADPLVRGTRQPLVAYSEGSLMTGMRVFAAAVVVPQAAVPLPEACEKAQRMLPYKATVKKSVQHVEFV